MGLLLVASSEDPASMNIRDDLLSAGEWDQREVFFDMPTYRHRRIPSLDLVTIPDKKIRHESLDVEVRDRLGLSPTLAVFLSRHRSKTGEPTLTVHPIGNYGEAAFGGKSRSLVPAAPRLMADLLRHVDLHLKSSALPFKVSYEVTHHGPSMEIPTVFIEIGSTEVQWNDPAPARIIGAALREVLGTHRTEESYGDDQRVLIGVGGGHYAPRFTDVALSRQAAFGHMIPTYQIDAGTIDDDMLSQALAKTPKASGVYFHRKELKKSTVTTLSRWFEDRGIPTVSSSALPAFGEMAGR